MDNIYPKLDFIGIGAEKSGTTWIADCLDEHPEVCFSQEKELFFFNEFDPHYLEVRNTRYERLGYEWYRKQFAHCDLNCMIGEFTPTYLYCPGAAERIKEAYPEIKLIVVLREPSSRAFSQYIHDQKIGLIKNITFESALDKYRNYIDKGFYSRHLDNYLSRFDRSQLLVLLLDELKDTPNEALKKVYAFLDLKDRSFHPYRLNKKSNQASKPIFAPLNYMMIQTEYLLRDKNLYKILKFFETTGLRKLAIKLRDANTKPLDEYPRMRPETEKRLKEIFREDIGILEKKHGLDLQSWRQ